MTALFFSAHIASREEKRRGASSRPFAREEVGVMGRGMFGVCREEVTGPNVVCGGGDTREEVGAAAFHSGPCVQGRLSARTGIDARIGRRLRI